MGDSLFDSMYYKKKQGVFMKHYALGGNKV